MTDQYMMNWIFLFVGALLSAAVWGGIFALGIYLIQQVLEKMQHVKKMKVALITGAIVFTLNMVLGAFILFAAANVQVM